MSFRSLPAVAMLTLGTVGCSDQSLPMATTPEQARPTLTAALDAWKQGKTAAELRSNSPPVYFNDDDFDRGRKLLDYQIEGDGTPRGTGYRFEVTLTLQDGLKPPTTRKLAYRVVNEPNISVSREDN